MNLTDDNEVFETEATPVTSAIVRAQVDSQVATARHFARSMTKFLRDSETLISSSTAVADECIYALPRGGKMIEGPSVRLAEIIAYAWGNTWCGGRIIEDAGGFIVAQGYFIDFERNNRIETEVRRRITGKAGARYSDDMVSMTSNAAVSLARRNAILAGVPQAVWQPLYLKARQTVAGEVATLPERRTKALDWLKERGATEEQVLTLLGMKGIDDIDLDALVTLRGVANALRDGETTVEQVFKPKPQASPTPSASGPAAGGVEGLRSVLTGTDAPPTPQAELMPVPEAISAEPLPEPGSPLFPAATGKKTK